MTCNTRREFMRYCAAIWLLASLPCLASQRVISFDVAAASVEKRIVFSYRLPASQFAGNTALLLVPSYNGSGKEMIERWTGFADLGGLILLAPTFETSPDELRQGKGYYYPEQWSGEVTEDAIAELERREGIQVDKILIFGFSAGAHFVHRFAMWKPGRVKAFVAYSAAWWSEPDARLASVPALVICGEDDLRYEASREFFEKALALGLPWIWRSYKGTGHEMTPAVQRMAEAFFGYYAKILQDEKSAEEEYVGDIQTYRFVPAREAEGIPPAVRIRLPSRELAEVWAREE